MTFKRCDKCGTDYDDQDRRDFCPHELSRPLGDIFFEALMANNNAQFDLTSTAPSMDGGDVAAMPTVPDLDKWMGPTAENFVDEEAWMVAGVGPNSNPQKVFPFQIDGKPVTREEYFKALAALRGGDEIVHPDDLT